MRGVQFLVLEIFVAAKVDTDCGVGSVERVVVGERVSCLLAVFAVLFVFARVCYRQ